MNIFKALSQGDGSINEPNITSFLSYLLNESTEFSSSIMVLFLELIEKESNIRFNNFLEISGETYREKIISFNKKYSYSAEPEKRVSGNSYKQDIDILLTISDKTNQETYCHLLIENKIKSASINAKQCVDQFIAFKNDEDFQVDVPVLSILISPDSNKFKVMADNIININESFAWLKWDSKENESIVSLLRKLVSLENNSEISPIDINSQYIIKSFIDYISTELNTPEKSYNFSIAGSNVIEEVEFLYQGNEYSLKRFSNHSIRIYKDNIDTKLTVKPILREIIKINNLDVNINSSKGSKKNTRVLGRDVIRTLNNL